MKRGGELVAQPVLALPGKISATGLALPESLTYDDWERCGEALQAAEGSISWWLGDWLNFGERKYAEKYSQALDPEAKNYGALRNAAWVSKQVELSRRRDKLSFAHHQDVAPLEPIEQDEWLSKAENEGLTSKELRVAIAAEKRTAKLAAHHLARNWRRAQTETAPAGARAAARARVRVATLPKPAASCAAAGYPPSSTC